MDAASPLQVQDPPHRLPLNRLAGRVGLLLLAGLLFLSLFPALVAPFDASARLGQPLERPGDTFLLGTNDIGQDLLSELIWGVRVSLLTGLAVAFLSVVIGASVGLFTGYFSGLLSSILLSLTSLAQVLPFLPLVILISAYLGPSQRNIVLVLVLFLWAVPARLVHSRVLSIAREDYIEFGARPGQQRLAHPAGAHLAGRARAGYNPVRPGGGRGDPGRSQPELPGIGQPDRQKLGRDAILCPGQRRLLERRLALVGVAPRPDDLLDRDQPDADRILFGKAHIPLMDDFYAAHLGEVWDFWRRRESACHISSRYQVLASRWNSPPTIPACWKARPSRPGATANACHWT